MTMTSNGQHDTAATGTATELTDADAALLARADWHASAGTLTGRELAERYGRSPRWGRKQRAAAEAEAAGGTVPGVVAAQLGVPRPGTPPVAPVPRSDRKRTPTARPRPAGTPRTLRWGMKLGFGIVAAVTAVASYMHIRDLALAAGMGSHAYWTPLGIDGLALICSCSVIVDRRTSTTPDRHARYGLALGFLGSLVANVLAVDPELVPLRYVTWVLAGYTPIALMVAGHLYLRHMGDQ